MPRSLRCALCVQGVHLATRASLPACSQRTSRRHELARGWGEAGLQGVARLDATAETSVKVPLPSEDGALEMLGEYIIHHRLPSKIHLEPLHPFTEAAARKLVSGVKPALHPRPSQKAHFAVRQAADDGLNSIEVAQIEKLFTNMGVEATASTGEPETFDTY